MNNDREQDNTAHETKSKLPVCMVSQLKGRSMLKGVSVLGNFSKNGLNLRITGPVGQAVLEFSSNAINSIIAKGVGSEFHRHRSAGYVLSSHPAVVGNLFRDLGIVVTPECIQVLETRLANPEQQQQPCSSGEPEYHHAAIPFYEEMKPISRQVDKRQSSKNRLNFRVRSTLMRDSALGKTAL